MTEAPFDPNHLIDIGPFSVKLTFTMKSGGIYHGTGFYVEHLGQPWLITCRHNVEDRTCDFIGTCDLQSMSLLGMEELQFGSKRRVVAIRIDGFIPDCAAIELFPGEWTDIPKFDSALKMPVEGKITADVVRLMAPPPATEEVKVEPAGWVLFQGFPGDETTPSTLKGIRLAALPSIIKPYMLSWLPACKPGFSGGPVLSASDEELCLLAITTHRFPASIRVRMEDGRMAEMEIQASVGMPIRPLLWATERAPPGYSIVEVPSPVAPFVEGSITTDTIIGTPK